MQCVILYDNNIRHGSGGVQCVILSVSKKSGNACTTFCPKSLLYVLLILLLLIEIEVNYNQLVIP